MTNSASLPEILIISSYPPRECGIATFTQDLRKALYQKFGQSFLLRICALETVPEVCNAYPNEARLWLNETNSKPEVRRNDTDEVRMWLNTTNSKDYLRIANIINADDRIQLVLLQHEFGFFADIPEVDFLHFLQQLEKPLIITFHTVLPHPDADLKRRVNDMGAACAAVIVMTENAAQILQWQYHVPSEKIQVIPHGVHLVPHLDKSPLKKKYGLTGRKILSTFGLISSGKSIETTLDALPAIVAMHPTVLFLAIGKTHPSVIKQEGERYRMSLEAKVLTLGLGNHVKFINAYLPLPELLEYLQLSDLYLFTSKDPNQAVSGTFLYAVSCACPIISTPIPHAREVLRDDAGILVDFQDASQLAAAVNHLLSHRIVRNKLINNGLQRVILAAWENTAVKHAMLFQTIITSKIKLKYGLPALNLLHIKKLTTAFGMIQFSKINQPDLDTGYTIDDNARALVAMCMHFEYTGEKQDLTLIKIYLDFIAFCQQSDGSFLNYVDANKHFTAQNQEVNLEDSNGRAVWALGVLISMKDILPRTFVVQAVAILERGISYLETIHSTRAMSFTIKGLYHYFTAVPAPKVQRLIKTLANRLVQMYRHEAEAGWHWYEHYLTYGNSTIPEALLLTWKATGGVIYKNIARESFDFLLQHTFSPEGITVIPNDGWMQKGLEKARFGEQPIDVAYSVMTLRLFYEVFQKEDYRRKMNIAFNWFLGQNHLHQIIYNPCTGGCYDGLEATQVNLNQGAESTVSYLMARLAVAMPFRFNQPVKRLFLEQNITRFQPSAHFFRPASRGGRVVAELPNEGTLTYSLEQF